ncbi:protein quaking isoform X2 [Nematostella vectensis]|uniref:protein quaking isoform X2 n=1 Tax=Nematostella vectensis TaxID=45351 RepID=UPI00139021DD|nr:protein quaking isoform X2 [Nematostella vectensis]XP_032225294.1 protein quaking isoform X2 [Nematostella vectensis]
MSIPSTSEYLNELLNDKTTVSKMPKIFLHAERLLDQEINKVRNELFHGATNGVDNGTTSIADLSLPAPSGPRVKLVEKVYAPVKEFPKFNFVGRVIGPRGMTLREIESTTGCKLLVRGKGSMKDKKLEEEKRGQPNYEHLDEDLHVLISCEDTEERCHTRLEKAVERVQSLLRPVEEGEDEIKKKQLKDLALLNGTLRESGVPGVTAVSSLPGSPILPGGLLGMPIHPGLAGYQLAARPPGLHVPSRIWGAAFPGAYPSPLTGLEFPYAATRPGTLLDYHAALEPSILGAVKPRRPIREHPYQR